ncbi:NUDIX domain-containing protein [Patescibacteria group bacterium]|nr:MAG: NUDIX domain-containing protein [Patescibacteria group bacterium]
MAEIKAEISDLVGQVKPLDQKEREHIQAVLEWIASGVEIFRIEKPATPSQHLVSYSVLVDRKKKKVLLLDHRKALKLLPGGGHVNKDELPFETAKRELAEELGIEAKPLFANVEVPFFVTIMETVGLTAGHLDVDLWYVFEGDSEIKINDETDEFKREFAGYHWLGFDEILSRPIEALDTHMHRFIEKLKNYL